jgi:hypothetical protein
MYYYYLVDMFGRVPLIVSSSIPVKDVRQSDRKEVFDFVVKVTALVLSIFII